MDSQRVETIVDVLRAIQDSARPSVGGKLGGHWFKREAASLGQAISSQTIDRLLAGTGKPPGPKTLEAISTVAQKYGIPPARVYATEGVPPPTGEFAKALPLGVDGLSRKTKAAIVQLLQALVETEVRDQPANSQAQQPDSPSLRLVGRQQREGMLDDGGTSDD